MNTFDGRGSRRTCRRTILGAVSLPPPDPFGVRISDSDRERAAERLHQGLAEGRITVAELEERASLRSTPRGTRPSYVRRWLTFPVTTSSRYPQSTRRLLQSLWCCARARPASSAPASGACPLDCG